VSTVKVAARAACTYVFTCMYMYVYSYVCIHLYVCLCIRTYARKYICFSCVLVLILQIIIRLSS